MSNEKKPSNPPANDNASKPTPDGGKSYDQGSSRTARNNEVTNTRPPPPPAKPKQ